MTKDTELAWAAGFLDGEGCWYAMKASKRKNGTQPRRFALSVNQADPRPLLRLAEIAGQGNVKGPYTPKERKVKRNKPVWYFVLSGLPAWHFYIRLEPYMSEPKKEQVQSIIPLLTDKFRADILKL